MGIIYQAIPSQVISSIIITMILCLVFILVGLVTFNFFFEFAINVIFAPALRRVIKVVNKE